MIKKLYTDLYADENILYFNEDAGNVVFYCNKMGTLNIDVNNINLDNNLTRMILILLFLSDFWFGIWNLKNAKHTKNISEELMPIILKDGRIFVYQKMRKKK